MKNARCILKAGKEKPLKGFHPWVFSGAIDEIDEECRKGDIVDIFSSAGVFLATGYFNPESQIAVRILSFESRSIDQSFIEERLQNAIELRSRLHFSESDTNAYRLVHGESDGLPGLIADKYADCIVIQVMTAGMERLKPHIVEALKKLINPGCIYEKSGEEFRNREGLLPAAGTLWGNLPADQQINIRENGIHFYVDPAGGQKTGFFLDQRENRLLVKDHSCRRRVLNCFSYTGGFSVYAAAGGADRVVSVDVSKPALALLEKNMGLNGITNGIENIEEDVFSYLRNTSGDFDFIILDPPAFCKSREQVQTAARGYKDINLWALKRIKAGGFLYTASCSSYVDAALFQKIVFAAAKDAGRSVVILKKTAHPPDHPISVFHPEGEYLKGLLCFVR